MSILQKRIERIEGRANAAQFGEVPTLTDDERAQRLQALFESGLPVPPRILELLEIARQRCYQATGKRLRPIREILEASK